MAANPGNGSMSPIRGDKPPLLEDLLEKNVIKEYLFKHFGQSVCYKSYNLAGP